MTDTNPLSRNTLADALLDAGAAYLGRGWSIIPIGMKKRPIVKWRQFQTKRATEQDLRNWCADPRITGLAVVLGDISEGLACRDFDTVESYAAWSSAHPSEGKILPTVRTARGYHVYFHRNALATRRKGDGEIRANGAYCLLPPSLHPCGPAYQWIIPPSGVIPEVDPQCAGLAESWDNRSNCAGVWGNRDIGKQGHSRQSGGSAITDINHPIVPKTVFPKIPIPLSTQKPTLGDVPEYLLVSGAHQHDEKNMSLARYLKFQLGISRIEDAIPYYQVWFERGRRFMQERNPDIARAKFETAFEIARIPLGACPAETAWKRVATAPPPPEAELFESEPVKLLVALLYQLGLDAHDEPFALSAYQAAHYVGFTPPNAHVALHAIARRKVIECVSRGKAGFPGKNASRWRWIGCKGPSQ